MKRIRYSQVILYKMHCLFRQFFGHFRVAFLRRNVVPMAVPLNRIVKHTVCFEYANGRKSDAMSSQRECQKLLRHGVALAVVHFLAIFYVINSNNMVENWIENDWGNSIAAIVANHKSNSIALFRTNLSEKSKQVSDCEMENACLYQPTRSTTHQVKRSKAAAATNPSTQFQLARMHE